MINWNICGRKRLYATELVYSTHALTRTHAHWHNFLSAQLTAQNVRNKRLRSRKTDPICNLSHSICVKFSASKNSLLAPLLYGVNATRSMGDVKPQYGCALLLRLHSREAFNSSHSSNHSEVSVTASGEFTAHRICQDT